MVVLQGPEAGRLYKAFFVNLTSTFQLSHRSSKRTIHPVTCTEATTPLAVPLTPTVATRSCERKLVSHPATYLTNLLFIGLALALFVMGWFAVNAHQTFTPYP